MGNYPASLYYNGSVLANTSSVDTTGLIDGGFFFNRIYNFRNADLGSYFGDGVATLGINITFKLSRYDHHTGGLFYFGTLANSWGQFYCIYNYRVDGVAGDGALQIHSHNTAWNTTPIIRIPFTDQIDFHNLQVNVSGTSVDAYFDGTKYSGTLPSALDLDGLPLVIGAYYTDSWAGWANIIDEVRVFSDVLTEAEISAIRNSGNGTDADSGVVAGAAINVNAIGTSSQITSGHFTGDAPDGELIEGDLEVQGDIACAGDVGVTGDLSAAGFTTAEGRILGTTRVTTTYQVLSTDHSIFADTDGGAFTVTLAAGVNGQELFITNCGSAGLALTLDGSGAETINGDLTQILYDGEAVHLIFETTEGWRIL